MCIKENWFKYHIAGCSNLHRIKRNVVFLHASNSKEHELKKCEICYELKKEGVQFITEAVCNKTNERHDIVNLATNDKIEIEGKGKRGKRHLGKPGFITIFY